MLARREAFLLPIAFALAAWTHGTLLSGNWILATHFWADVGIWIDTAVWLD